MKRPLVLTCSLCSQFDPNRSVCTLNNERREAISYEYAPRCKEEGNFLRYMYVLPDAYNYYSINEEIPGNWRIDLSKVPKDEHGIPLFVSTKRGLERAVPANQSATLRGDPILGVPRILTYQGQWELIYEIGVDWAREQAEAGDVELTVLPYEEGWQGVEAYKREHTSRVRVDRKARKTPWLNNEPTEGWD